MGLTGFIVVLILSGDGNVQHSSQPDLTSVDSAKPDKSVESNELPAPAPQKIAKASEPQPAPTVSPEPVLPPSPPPVAQAPVVQTLVAQAPVAQTPIVQAPVVQAPVAQATVAQAPVMQAPVVQAPVASAETEPSPVVQLPKVPEPPQVTNHVDEPAASAPSPLPQVAPAPALAPEKPADTAAQMAAPAPAMVQHKQGDVIRDCANCPELIAVSAGSYMKVDDANSKAPAKLTTINHDFAIGRNDITFDDWDKCVGDGACQPIADDAGWGRGTRPLIFVSFDDVTTQYLPWLAKLTGKAYRLPTKDEWQYAALGGQGAAQAKSQSGAASQDCFNASGAPAANCADTFDGTAPVGSFPKNTLGLNDMKGNVWEWSTDCWRPFSYAPSALPNDCATRVVLGGAWSTNRSVLNGQVAAWEKSSKKANSIGFRVVRSLP